MSNIHQNLTAIIYDRKGRVLSVGKNNYLKTHPLQAKHANRVGEEHKIFLHAEIDAIAKCRNLDRAYKIFVMRVNSQGRYMLAAPCKICQDAIAATPIKIVEHT